MVSPHPPLRAKLITLPPNLPAAAQSREEERAWCLSLDCAYFSTTESPSGEVEGRGGEERKKEEREGEREKLYLKNTYKKAYSLL